jgi:hypothetical protein
MGDQPVRRQVDGATPIVQGREVQLRKTDQR